MRMKRRHTEEGTGGKDGDDEGLVGGGKGIAGGICGGVRGGLTESAKPVVHLDDTRDGTGVVAEEDTTEGGEGGHGDARKLVLVADGGTDALTRCDGTTCHCGRYAFAGKGGERERGGWRGVG